MLSATQLNATSSVPGTFVYTPAAGATLEGGKPDTVCQRQVWFAPGDRTLMDTELLNFHGCPPGIRTPIDRFRADCPTIERGGKSLVLRGLHR